MPALCLVSQNFEPSQICLVRHEIESYLQEMGLSDGFIYAILLAIGEAIANVPRHSKDKEIQINVTVFANCIVVARIYAACHRSNRRLLQQRLRAIRQGLVKCNCTEEGGAGLFIISKSAKVKIGRSSNLILIFEPGGPSRR